MSARAEKTLKVAHEIDRVSNVFDDFAGYHQVEAPNLCRIEIKAVTRQQLDIVAILKAFYPLSKRFPAQVVGENRGACCSEAGAQRAVARRYFEHPIRPQGESLPERSQYPHAPERFV